jgi:hypothetical protein
VFCSGPGAKHIMPHSMYSDTNMEVMEAKTNVRSTPQSAIVGLILTGTPRPVNSRSQACCWGHCSCGRASVAGASRAAELEPWLAAGHAAGAEGLLLVLVAPPAEACALPVGTPTGAGIVLLG